VTAPATATTTDLVSETHLPKPYDIVQGMEPMWTSHAKEFQKRWILSLLKLIIKYMGVLYYIKLYFGCP
jgi:hypothetical protein